MNRLVKQGRWDPADLKQQIAEAPNLQVVALLKAGRVYRENPGAVTRLYVTVHFPRSRRDLPDRRGSGSSWRGAGKRPDGSRLTMTYGKRRARNRRRNAAARVARRRQR